MILRIRFTGLCLYARDVTNNVLHVLMPTTSDCCDAHQSVIFIDKAAALSGNPNANGAVPVPFANLSLNIDALAAGKPVPKVPTNIFDMGKHLNAVVRRDRLFDSSHVFSRVTLAGGNLIPGPQGGRWKMRSNGCGISEVEMTNQATWQLNDLPDGNFIHPLRPVAGGAPNGDVAVRPVGGVLALHVYHGDAKYDPTGPATPPEPPPNNLATHYQAMYRLVRSDCEPIPYYLSPPASGNKDRDPLGRGPDGIIGDLLTCMSGQAPVG